MAVVWLDVPDVLPADDDDDDTRPAAFRYEKSRKMGTFKTNSPILKTYRTTRRSRLSTRHPGRITERIIPRRQRRCLHNFGRVILAWQFSAIQNIVHGYLLLHESRGIRVQNFFYDGTAPAAYFWAGSTSGPDQNGHILPYPFTGTFYRPSKFTHGRYCFRIELFPIQSLSEIVTTVGTRQK